MVGRGLPLGEVVHLLHDGTVRLGEHVVGVGISYYSI